MGDYRIAYRRFNSKTWYRVVEEFLPGIGYVTCSFPKNTEEEARIILEARRNNPPKVYGIIIYIEGAPIIYVDVMARDQWESVRFAESWYKDLPGFLFLLPLDQRKE